MSMPTLPGTRFGSIRYVLRDGAAWVVADDICPALGFASRDKLLVKLDAEEKAIETQGCVSYQVISKQGLYHACLLSDSPNARPMSRLLSAKTLPKVEAESRRDAAELARSIAEQMAELAELVDAMQPKARKWEAMTAEMADSVRADVFAELGFGANVRSDEDE